MPRIPSLDGLRAISITLVILGHLGGARGFARVDLGIGDYAHLGVTVFFVISGFLITSLLLKEEARTGTISLRKFYARRSLRILPPMYAYLACMVALSWCGVVRLGQKDVLMSSAYLLNYLPSPNWVVGHLWSLSVEEQFYLLWPAAFILGGMRREWAVYGVVAFGPLARIFMWAVLGKSEYGPLQVFPVVADSMALGCLLAMRRDWVTSSAMCARLMRPWPSLLVLAGVLLVSRWRGNAAVFVFGDSLANAGIALLIHRSIARPADLIGSLLNWRPLAGVGVLSYSLYLWQQFFLDRTSTAWYAAWPQNLALALCAAVGSYLLIEMPIVWLRAERSRRLAVARPAT